MDPSILPVPSEGTRSGNNLKLEEQEGQAWTGSRLKEY